MKFLLIGTLLAFTLAGSVTRTVKYDTAMASNASLPCFEKETWKFTKNKAIDTGHRFRTEKGGDWFYTASDGKTKYGVDGLGLDEAGKWYSCDGDKNSAETPSGTKCMQWVVQTTDFETHCKYSDYELSCDYDPDDKYGGYTVEDWAVEYEKLRTTKTEYVAIYDKQYIFWECEFATGTAEVSATCGKAKLVKTKADKDFDDSKKCFASKFGGLVSALLVLTGLMN